MMKYLAIFVMGTNQSEQAAWSISKGASHEQQGMAHGCTCAEPLNTNSV